jgi:hypothetical protein
MQLADSQQTAIGYLILRHLYDGDAIEWPISDGHPQQPVFAALEQGGQVARWDRVWPLTDRYRLTETGIATIEAVYKPAGADALWNELRARDLEPADRRTFLQSKGLDPMLWPVLHDPSTHWDSFATEGGLYWNYVWEDQRPFRRRRPPEAVVVTPTPTYSYLDDDDQGFWTYYRKHRRYSYAPRMYFSRYNRWPWDWDDDEFYWRHGHYRNEPLFAQYLVDLDTEANVDDAVDDGVIAAAADYDVS